MVDVVEVLQHWHAGRSKSVIAESLGLDVKTVRKYVAPAEAAGMEPGGPRLERAAWAELVRSWFPGLVDARLIERLARDSPLPLNVMVATGTPPLSTLSDCGVARVSHGPGPYLTAMKALEDAARQQLSAEAGVRS